MNQVELVLCDLEAGDSRMTTWLDRHPRLQEGGKIALKDYRPDTVWTVRRIYEGPIMHYAADFDFHRKWDNNNYDKHEGLGV